MTQNQLYQFVHVLLLLLISTTSLIAQGKNDNISYSEVSSTPAAFSKPQELDNLQRKHSIGLGGGILTGDAATGREALLLSGFYAYSFSSTLDGEVSFQQMLMPLVGGTDPRVSFLALSTAMMFDMTLMAKSSIGSSQFRYGIGASVRWQQSGIRATRTTLDPAGQSKDKDVVMFQNTTAVGLSVKLEHLLPISPILDLAIRAQGHIFAPPFFGHNFHVPANLPGGSVSISLFIIIRR
jgi:hypothetical protein